VVAKDTGNLSQNARLILHSKPEIISANNLIHRFYFTGGHLRLWASKSWRPGAYIALKITGNRQDIPHDSTCSSVHPGTITGKHNRTGEVTDQANTVEYTIDRRKRIVFRNHGRVDPGFNPFAITLTDRQKLKFVAETMCKLYIKCSHLTDAFGIDLVKIHPGAKTEADQECKLMRSINSFNIKGRISLGIAMLLGFGQYIGKGLPFLVHLGQNVVTGTVENTVKS